MIYNSILLFFLFLPIPQYTEDWHLQRSKYAETIEEKGYIIIATQGDFRFCKPFGDDLVQYGSISLTWCQSPIEHPRIQTWFEEENGQKELKQGIAYYDSRCSCWRLIEGTIIYMKYIPMMTTQFGMELKEPKEVPPTTILSPITKFKKEIKLDKMGWINK